jgi:cytochrome P450
MRTMNTDPTNFPDPHVFNPDRFLAEDGSINRKFKFMPFQSGKRQCVGESLAWTFMFVTLASLLQKFHLLPVPGYAYSFEHNMQSNYTLGVQNYPVTARLRDDMPH